MQTPGITAPLLQHIARHAEAEYPLECCGVLLGPVEDPAVLTTAERCHNIQDILHRQDPAQFPAEAQQAYVIDPQDLLRLQKHCRTHSQAIRVIYHSHPDADPFFSSQDQKLALWEGEPLYPETAYFVASVQRGKASRYALYQWDLSRRGFLLISQGYFSPSRI